MPQRFLRPGITTSALWNSVPFAEQSLFIRLLTLVDDFGRCDGRASVIGGQVFAVWNEQNPRDEVTMTRTAEMLQRLAAAHLIDLYDADGKRVLQICQWQERVREGSKEKWPINPNRSDARQSAATCSNPQQSAAPLIHPPPPPPTPSSIRPSFRGMDSETASRLDGILKDTARAISPALFKKPTAEEVAGFMEKLFRGAEAFASAFVEAMEKQGWRDRRGQLVKDWRSLAKAYANKSESNRRKAGK